MSKRFGIILRDLRRQKRLSQAELANLSDLDRTFISLLERGVRQPTLETLFRIASALEVKPSEIIKKLEMSYED